MAERYHLTYQELTRMVSQVGEHLGEIRREDKPLAPLSQRRKKTEDRSLRPQKLLLSWMSSDLKLYRNIVRYVEPEDFTDPFCRRVAELLSVQAGEGKLNPAALFQQFTEEEDQQKLAELLEQSIPSLSGRGGEEKALQETILRVKQNSISWQTEHMDPGDMDKLREIVQKRRDMEKLHISLD